MCWQLCRAMQPTKAFLGNKVNRTRLRELLQFVLSHFTNGPDARRLNELLQANQPAASSSGGGGNAAGAGDTGSRTSGAGNLGAAAPPAPAPLAASIPAYAAGAMQFESNSLSERVQKPALLAPVMGILLAIWDAHKALDSGSAPGGASSGGDSLSELAEIATERFMLAMQFMRVSLEICCCLLLTTCS